MKRDMHLANCNRREYATGLRYHRVLIASAALAAFAGATSVAASEKVAEPAKIETTKAQLKTQSRGLSLGDYRIRSYYPVDAQKSTVRFTLYASIKSDHFEPAERLVEEHREKIRDVILTATRLAPLAVFQEPSLDTFRRRILVRLRREFPQLNVDALYISDFDLVIKSL